MKKLLLLAALACAPFSVNAYWFQRKPTKKQIIYLKTKQVLSHKAVAFSVGTILGYVLHKEFEKYKSRKAADAPFGS